MGPLRCIRTRTSLSDKCDSYDRSHEYNKLLAPTSIKNGSVSKLKSYCSNNWPFDARSAAINQKEEKSTRRAGLKLLNGMTSSRVGHRKKGGRVVKWQEVCCCYRLPDSLLRDHYSLKNVFAFSNCCLIVTIFDLAITETATYFACF